MCDHQEMPEHDTAEAEEGGRGREQRRPDLGAGRSGGRGLGRGAGEQQRVGSQPDQGDTRRQRERGGEEQERAGGRLQAEPPGHSLHGAGEIRSRDRADRRRPDDERERASPPVRLGEIRRGEPGGEARRRPRPDQHKRREQPASAAPGHGADGAHPAERGHPVSERQRRSATRAGRDAGHHERRRGRTEDHAGRRGAAHRLRPRQPGRDERAHGDSGGHPDTTEHGVDHEHDEHAALDGVVGQRCGHPIIVRVERRRRQGALTAPAASCVEAATFTYADVPR
jgi:hypothetical protein